jgi:ribosomal protein L44E
MKCKCNHDDSEHSYVPESIDTNLDCDKCDYKHFEPQEGCGKEFRLNLDENGICGSYYYGETRYCPSCSNHSQTKTSKAKALRGVDEHKLGVGYKTDNEPEDFGSEKDRECSSSSGSPFILIEKRNYGKYDLDHKTNAFMTSGRIYPEEDVKEFIRLLKEEMPLECDNDEWIDKLTGDLK